MNDMITIDGAHGEGGGQVLRSALAASLITGRPLRIENVRGQRSKPGLLRQHLTGLRAAAEIGDARLEGAEMGSKFVTFAPRTIRPGDYRFQVGSAGSAVLVIQTVLPALFRADGPSTLVVTGGTHASWAPSFDFLDRTYLPCLRSMGLEASATLERYGFYPAGGGQITVRVEPIGEPALLKPFELLERGADQGRSAEALVARIPRNIAERQLRTVTSRLGWTAEEDDLRVAETDRSVGPGNAITLAVQSERVTEVFVAYGKLGVPAERIAREAVKQARAYLVTDAPVGEFLADQLLLPMTLVGGGSFRTTKITRHTQTNLDVLARFFAFDAEVTRESGSCRLTMKMGHEEKAGSESEADQRPNPLQQS